MGSRRRPGFAAATAVLACLVAGDAGHAQSGSAAPDAPEFKTTDDARRFFVCRTLMSFDPGHGTQVFYIRPDGTEFLWYPGNRVIVTSRWHFRSRVSSLDPPKETIDMCFQYGTSTYNPVTKRRGGAWECRPARAVARLVLERVEGDVFGLARRLPFVLPREGTSIGELRKTLQSSRPLESQPDGANETGCPRDG